MTNGQEPSSEQCSNCGGISAGLFCAHCGQKFELAFSITDYVREALPGIASGDGRFTRTFKLLVLNPGMLTRRYHAGKRTHYASPMGMLLSAVFLLFTLPLITGSIPGTSVNEQQTRDELVSNIAVLDSEIAEMALDIKKAQGQRRLDLIVEFDSKFFDRNLSARLSNTPTTSRDQYADIFSELDGEKREAGWLERKIDRMAMEWERNPELKSSALRSTLIKYSWFLIPLSLPGMIIFMPGGYADRFKHAIFIGYSISFVLFFASLLMILIRFEIPDVPLFAASIITMMIHLFVQTKQSYRLSWLKAIWHYLVVLGCAVFALALFVVILFLLNLI